jgi:hypothetical protein
MWRAHPYRKYGGVALPTSEGWLGLTAADFDQFLMDEAGGPVPAAGSKSSSSSSSSSLLLLETQAAALVARRFVESIMGQRPETIVEGGDDDDGMLVMRDVVVLETGESEDLVLRNVTRPFWQACIDAAAGGKFRRVGAVGTPGIGKTTCTPFLVRMLLEQRKTAVYRVRTGNNDGWIYEFIPGPVVGGNGGPVAANVYPEHAFASGIASLKDPATYYVVDPGQTKDNCNPEANFRPKVINVTSPDPRHWGGGEFFKRRGSVNGELKIFPLWELEELLRARPVLGPQLSVAEVKNRYYQVGGVPRQVFADDVSFSRTLDLQSLAVSDLTPDQLEKIATLQVKSVTTFDPAQPKSALLGFRVPGDDGTFSRYTVHIIAPRLALVLYREFMKAIWSKLRLPSVENTYFFEVYSRLLMVVSSTFSTRQGVGKRDPRRKALRSKTLGGCNEIRLERDIVSAAVREKLVVFHPVDPANRLIDFIYRDSHGHFHAFQVTMAAKHTADVDDILKLEELVGGPAKLSLYYMVPEFYFFDFVTQPVDPQNPGGGRLGKKNATCSIFHLCVPDPSANGMKTKKK